MGYSKSLRTLEQFYEYMQPLEKGEPYAWVLSGEAKLGDADKLAYKIRECLYIARLYPDKYPALATAADKFVIEIISLNKVQARLSIVPTEARILTSGPGQASPTHGLSDVPLGRAIATSGEQTVFTIIDAWKKAQPNNTPIHFPQAKLSYPQLVALWKWAQTWRPPLMLMVDDAAITVGPVEDEVVQYSWRPRPEDLPPEHEPPKSFPVPPRPY